MQTSDKKWSMTLILLLIPFIGTLGAHRYYTGHIKQGLLRTCTASGCFLLWWYDLYLLITKKFTDVDGKPLAE